MTNAVSAARMLVSDVVGDNTPWMSALHHRITTPAAIGAGLGENAAVAWWFARGWARALTNPLLPGEEPVDGTGVVGSDGFRPVARSTVNGETCSLSAVCPHLGGVVSWNDQELSWDCPLHGSRFTAAGGVIEGPAKRGLTPRAS
ncbi:hypothetical protein GCM10025867_23230 [Frondihabitans sucicola]|uniref:Rieske domain-containing protein n=1 Tax=Frondihabitans sucicola TaxID=1268041 RepID=A0ABN6XYG8_9MICO|nr:Rieske 2Fe-2S domain-containing protein [Frondihabitans sucicola]BDZ50082.1 hypothetical protein GCM10025867_23230 [Frondihabitans sucicola]